MLTEAEAKTKWCPMVRTVSPMTGTNRDRYEGTDCIGSACMMWRWDEAWESAVEEGHSGDVLLRLKRRAGQPKRGCCGLAGRPE